MHIQSDFVRCVCVRATKGKHFKCIIFIDTIAVLITNVRCISTTHYSAYYKLKWLITKDGHFSTSNENLSVNHLPVMQI